MSIGVLGGRRTFRWESASKPALNRCIPRAAQGQHPPASLPHHLRLYPCPHRHLHHHLHHRPRRRHISADAPPWQRRPSDVVPPSVASSWQTEPSSLLTPDTLSVSGERSASSAGGSSHESRNVLLPKRPCVTARMSSASAPRSGAADDSGESPTAAAREVKQYLNRTLFPRPSSTLHGYASLYHRLRKLPATHRKARQRGKTAPEASAPPPSGVSERDPEGNDECKANPRESAGGVAPCPPRVEIHIYVPTAAATAPAPLQQEGDAQRNL
ncbi:uncharacterized protein LOC122254477 [Penaeus japonicus]|uniref:uncharacterized protein LOC122254477 n=1 Tax=Penaeus japonicus TaxID=27405 RepID=UPI001C70BFA7|nr:uncharacterized protein LOC122254477 [Penaeus japonicus]